MPEWLMVILRGAFFLPAAQGKGMDWSAARVEKNTAGFTPCRPPRRFVYVPAAPALFFKIHTRSSASPQSILQKAESVD
jgi:hypothetical protein